jgi:hypothetical protein
VSSSAGDVDRLRESYLAALREATSDAAEGPDAGLIWEAVSGALPAERRREVVDRVATDAAWAEAWRLAVEIHGSLGEGAEVASPSSPSDTSAQASGFWKRFGTLAAAASILALVGGGLLVREALAPGPVYRSPGDESIRSLLSEDASVSRDSIELRWTPAAPGSRYEVTVTTESLRVIAAARDLGEPRFSVPDSAVASLPGGAKLFWRVTARSRDGAETHSPTFVLNLQ